MINMIRIAAFKFFYRRPSPKSQADRLLKEHDGDIKAALEEAITTANFSADYSSEVDVQHWQEVVFQLAQRAG